MDTWSRVTECLSFPNSHPEETWPLFAVRKQTNSQFWNFEAWSSPLGGGHGPSTQTLKSLFLCSEEIRGANDSTIQVFIISLKKKKRKITYLTLRFLCLKGREGKGRDLIFADSLSKLLWWLGLGQDKAGSQEPHANLSHRWQGSKYLSHTHCLEGALSRKLDWDSNQLYDMGCGYSKWKLAKCLPQIQTKQAFNIFSFKSKSPRLILWHSSLSTLCDTNIPSLSCLSSFFQVIEN